MRKPTICICENKDADQLRGNREADQRLYFRYTDSAVPLLSKSKTSCLQPSSVLVQPGLYQTCSETTLLVFPRGGSVNNIPLKNSSYCRAKLPFKTDCSQKVVYSSSRFRKTL